MYVYRHADTHKLALVRCRGVRRMHLNSNMSACEQAPVSQFGSSAHGSLLHAKFQFVPLLWVLNLIGNNAFRRGVHLNPLLNAPNGTIVTIVSFLLS